MRLALALIAFAGWSDTQVVLRDPSVAPITDVVEVGPAGVILAGASPRRIIPWNLVRRVDGPHADQAAEFLRAGDDLWRSLGRIARGDLPSAESLLESISGESVTTPGPTAQIVWLALARCRLERGAHTAATAAWLEWLAVRTPDDPLIESTPLPWASHAAPDQTGLVPHLPPIWVNVPSVAVAAGEHTRPWSAGFADRDDDAGRLAETLRGWYVQAARGACDLPTGPWPEPTDHPGVALVSAVVLAQHGDEGERHSAREQLRSLLGRGAAPWIESWCRVALGRSLLRESDAETRRLGVVELLHVPARLESAVPYLTGIALADAAAGLRMLGDHRGATTLRDELIRRYSGHPALEWSQVRDWPAAPIRPVAPDGGDSEAGSDRRP
ncbi:MAG: hypothetical protein KF787_09085 [Phycisphaeraceae bacterium]|nr:hypothetical protein [Phycisphaerae bacterium]MBX3392787.1 hypothetical protein [Phycisphaeraceae bacterium]